MQISKSFLVVCAAAFCAALLPVRAADTDAQVKAREALEKKLQEMETQPAPATATPSVTAPKPKQRAAPPTVAAPVVAPAPAVTAPAPKAAPAASPAWRTTPPGQFTPTPTPAIRSRPAAAPSGPVLVAPPAVDAASVEKAREALHQKMKELEDQPAPGMKETVAVAPPAPKVTAPVAPPPPPVQPVPPPPQPRPVTAPAVKASTLPALQAPTPTSEENIAKARAAMEQRMNQLEAQPPVQPSPGSVVLAPAPQAPAARPVPRPPKPAHTLQPFSPLPAPPPAIAGDKQQRLDELLRKYRADQLTPEEYHQQRAKIVNER